MKNILGVFLYSILFVLALSGCRKDLGNYEYVNQNAVKITTDMTNANPSVFITPDSIVLTQNEILNVKIKLEQSLGTANNFSYQWILTQYDRTNANPAKHILDSIAELKIKITLAPNLYKLVVKVTDKSTGVSFYKYFALNILANPWGGEGWVVLQEKTDGADISVITTRDGSVRGNVYNDVYSVYNGHRLPLGTYKANVINYTTNQRAQKVSFFYPNGGIQVRSIDFADSTKAEYWFAAKPSSLNFQANGSAGGSSSGYEYVIVNNQVAYRQVSGALINNPPPFYPPFEGLTVSPFVISSATSDQYYTLYDKVKRGFVLFRADNSTLPNIPNYAAAATNLNPITGSGFDLKNIRHNLIHAENAQPLTSGTNAYWNCFFRNNSNDSTFLFQFPRNIGYPNNFTTGRFFLKETLCPGINAATMFAVPTHLPMPRGAFYYVNGNKIYTCKVNNLATSTASVGVTYPAGTIIKTMKVFNSGYAAANITALGVPEGKVLVVATDETASGGGNRVYFFNIDATGTILGTPANPVNMYTGFDKITDIVFKKGLGL